MSQPDFSVIIDNRTGRDRRSRPTPLFSRYTFFGRRKTVRRLDDSCLHCYVDRYDLSSVLLVLVSLILCVADAFMTMYLIDNGATELNPIMEKLLGHKPFLFLLVKYSLTALGMVWLLIHKNFYPLNGTYSVQRFMVVVPILYATLILYEMTLFLSVN